MEDLRDNAALLRSAGAMPLEERSAAPMLLRGSALGLMLLFHAGACVQTAPAEPAPRERNAAPVAAHGAGAAGSSRSSVPRSEIDAGGMSARASTSTCTGTSAQAGARLIGVMTWNLEWFQDPNEGPIDDAAQYAAVLAILEDSDASVIALQEIASEAAFERLLADLAERSGVLSGYAATQKTALLWNPLDFELVSVHALSGLDDAGRPPLEVELRSRCDARALLAVVIHAKAQADELSRATRARLAQGVKAHLDRAHVNTAAIVLGDFNDSLIGSIVANADSPYRAFIDDHAKYATPTRPLDQADAVESSYASGGATIDHIIVSAELAARVDSGSVDVLRDELLQRYPDYVDTVSDHFPVTLSFAW